MLIEDNTLIRIDPEDIIDGLFIAPDEVLYIGNYLQCDDVVRMVLPNVVEIGHDFLDTNTKLIHLDMPKVDKIGIYFLFCNTIIESIYMPNIKEIGSWFLLNTTKFQYTPRIIKALKSNMCIGGEIVDKKEYLRKLNIKKLLC